MHLLVSKDHGVSGKALADTKGTAVSRKLDGSSTGGRSGVTTPPKGSSIMGEKTEKPQEVLPCPRCQSMNTKFCYYNNYSVNQPRYFCRQCQRYWTVGGTLRNVPVGGGSRKKNRRGVTEPYPRRSSAAETTPLAMATPGMSPTMSFQQFLANDVPGSFLFSQTGPYGVYPVVDQSGQGIQYLTPPMYGQSGALGDNNCFPDLSAGTTLQGNDQSSVGVKTEFRGSSHMNMAQHQPVWDSSQAIDQSQSDRGSKPGCDSSMLLQLGLTNRPIPESGASAGTKGPVWNEVAPKNSSSPPHGSSTIEEEGNTPTNCYSNNGYEEGDAVSSMWAQNMHDMQDILSSTL